MKKRSCFSHSNQLQTCNGYITLITSSPTSPCTHLSLPLPIINDPLDEVLLLNLNLGEHFEHMDLDIPHSSSTLECTSNIMLHPSDKPIELAQTPSLSPMITLPIEQSTHKEPPTTINTKAPSTSQEKQGLHHDELSWAFVMEDNVQNILTRCKTLRSQIKDQEEDKQG